MGSGRRVALAGGARAVANRGYYLVRASGSNRPEVNLLVDWLIQEAAATEAGEHA